MTLTPTLISDLHATARAILDDLEQFGAVMTVEPLEARLIIMRQLYTSATSSEWTLDEWNVVYTQVETEMEENG
ncbi:MAG: hypothetical protein GY820_39470 [Gammaproteobacteria bacterium]|nr:hypothetical protein [Gammaproteobacteria bacterium]